MKNEKLTARGIVKQMIADGVITDEQAAKYIPELKEENEDEKIRKHLIKHFENKSKEDWNGVPVKNILAYLKKHNEQSPAWSAEDEKFFKTALWHLSYSISNGNDTNIYCDTTNWFRNLKNRVKPQPKQEWSEEDSKNMKECVIAVSMSEGHDREEKERLEDWLKYHFSQKQCGYNPYKEVVESIAEMCEKYNLSTSDLSDFLDNVKVKCKEAKEYDVMFPQNTWKPSEEQMDALRYVANHYVPTATDTLAWDALNTTELMLEQLEKL